MARSRPTGMGTARTPCLLNTAAISRLNACEVLGTRMTFSRFLPRRMSRVNFCGYGSGRE